MKIKYFGDTDTLYVELDERFISQSSDLDENTVLDRDEKGNVCAITLEHASTRIDFHDIAIEGISN